MEVLRKSISELKEPFESIDIKGFDELYIEGYKFPIKADSDTFRQLKEPKEYEGLIDILKTKLSINEKETEQVENLLKSINYYKISVFTKLLDQDKSFRRLIQLYEFDAFLKKELTPLLKELENLFKARLTYFLVNNYDKMSCSEEGSDILIKNNPKQLSSEFYLDYGIYETDEKEKIDKIISKFAENIIGKSKKELYIQHHIDNYGGHIPFWVLVETLTFGEIIHFYSFLSKGIRKAWRKEFFKVNVVKESEIEWLKTLQFLRNDCAHDNRLFGRTFNFTPLIHINDMIEIFGKENTELSLIKRKKALDKEKYDELKVIIEKSKKTLFSALVVMRYFVESASDTTQHNWNTFIEKLSDEIAGNKIDLYRIGFTKNWKKILTV